MNLELPLEAITHGPDFRLEERLISQGNALVAGCDEVGRGPLAGPVVAAAVILDGDHIPDGLNDSKKLTDKKRSALFSQILTTSIAVSWYSANAETVDRKNILQASLFSMARALEGLSSGYDHALIDGNQLPKSIIGKSTAIVKGDGRSLSIAAASIVAKVIRDRMMERAHQAHPCYGFNSHKGYGSKKHRDAIAIHGPCLLHRMSFAPMKNMAK